MSRKIAAACLILLVLALLVGVVYTASRPTVPRVAPSLDVAAAPAPPPSQIDRAYVAQKLLWPVLVVIVWIGRRWASREVSGRNR
jgi:hypothetical protein